MRLLRLLPIIWLAWLPIGLFPSLATAATYFVDGGCPTSGTGANVVCGAGGPMRTVMEAVQKAAQSVGYD
ncbi:MAG TPA: hypothetical protein VMT89_04435, partial [Candidatus Acidoferrales bacterium]|nr:hypothetical protein [Candidatus Acidoferrales bacterium]